MCVSQPVSNSVEGYAYINSCITKRKKKEIQGPRPKGIKRKFSPGGQEEKKEIFIYFRYVLIYPKINCKNDAISNVMTATNIVALFDHIFGSIYVQNA